MSIEVARAALQNPQVSPPVLVDIANNYPDLHAEIASHPAAYPELLNWLATTSPNEAARHAATARLQPQSTGTTEESAPSSEATSSQPPAAAPTSNNTAAKTKRKLWPLLAAGLAVIVVGALALMYLRPAGDTAAADGVTLTRLKITGEPVRVATLDAAPYADAEQDRIFLTDPVKPYFAFSEVARQSSRSTVYQLQGEKTVEIDLPKETIQPASLGTPVADIEPLIVDLNKGMATYFWAVESETAPMDLVVTFANLSDKTAFSVAIEPDKYEGGAWSFSSGPGKNYIVGFTQEGVSVSKYENSADPVWESQLTGGPRTGELADYDFPGWLASDNQLVVQYSPSNDAGETRRPNAATIVNLETGETQQLEDTGEWIGGSIWPKEGSLRWIDGCRDDDECVGDRSGFQFGPADLTQSADSGAAANFGQLLQWYYPTNGNASILDMLVKRNHVPQYFEFGQLKAASEPLEKLPTDFNFEPGDTALIDLLPDGTPITTTWTENSAGGTSIELDELDGWENLPKECHPYGFVDSGNTAICYTFRTDEIRPDAMRAYRKGESSPIFNLPMDVDDSRQLMPERVGLNNWIITAGADVYLLK